MTRRFSPEGLVAGLALVGLGVVWTLANMGYLDGLRVLRTWWPSLLVIWGTLEIVRAREAAHRTPTVPEGRR